MKSVSFEKSGITDIELLKWANLENRVILTFDRDYGELIFKYKLPIPKGVIYFRFEPKYPIEVVEILNSIIESGLKIEDRYSVVERDKIRQRELNG
ncbi:MAG: DUF5615 family PIN-like protein [Campylobacterales bacterium]|nr:DUF5615 family PIN-like protein [Campylobacterales bacterium]